MQPLTAPLRARASVPHRDPAPSKAAYRLQRLWLTPLFRALLRIGVPAFVVTFSVGTYLGDPDHRLALTNGLAEMRTVVAQRPEFIVSAMAVDGASPALADAIRAVAALALPQSSLDLDLAMVRARIVTLDAVAEAELSIKPGGVLQATITERVPALVWRTPEALELLDATGRRVARVMARADRDDLPLIAGDGADKVAAEALQLIAAARPLLPRLRGLVWIGERRWDLVLDRNQRILLPPASPVRALERIIALDQAQDLLARDILAIDLRIQSRPVLRLAPDALRELRHANGIATAENTL
ncbi:MAG: cell division protein FtsQ/DivIB [Pseudorhodobacter sp.]|nr:cell division protein FtsQ/DivIB [Pseudorhodobacter sp.]